MFSCVLLWAKERSARKVFTQWLCACVSHDLWDLVTQAWHIFVLMSQCHTTTDVTKLSVATCFFFLSMFFIFTARNENEIKLSPTFDFKHHIHLIWRCFVCLLHLAKRKCSVLKFCMHVLGYLFKVKSYFFFSTMQRKKDQHFMNIYCCFLFTSNVIGTCLKLSKTLLLVNDPWYQILDRISYIWSMGQTGRKWLNPP